MNTNEDAIFTIVTSLKVISRIKEGEKVGVRNGLLLIERTPGGLASACKRWYYQDSRYKTYNYIKSVITNSLLLLNNLREEEDIHIMVCALRESINGITKLKVTYNQDDSLVAALDVLVERMTRACEKKICVVNKQTTKND